MSRHAFDGDQIAILDIVGTMRCELLEADRVYSIVGAFYAVHDYYGFGLSEAVYAGAMEYELIERGHQVVRELSIAVSYKGRHVAWQRLDMVVDDRVIIENKATEKLSPAAAPQLISYLRASVFEVGVLLHFGRKATFQRFIDSPKRPFPPVLVDSPFGLEQENTNSTNSANVHEQEE